VTANPDPRLGASRVFFNLKTKDTNISGLIWYYGLMTLLKVAVTNLQEVLNTAVETLETGGIVAYPTETFYGLGVKFDLETSLKRLYEIKQRPKNKAMPLIIGKKRLLSSISSSINSVAESLIDGFWPGPLTLLVPAKENISEWLTAGTGKVAVRVPGESFALRLARHAGFPVTSTSANISGFPPARDAATVIKYFSDDIDLIVDGGETPGGLPSTIADTTGNGIKILREGAILP
jgi:L-threonylcarbamoyladenylate synthase